MNDLVKTAATLPWLAPATLDTVKPGKGVPTLARCAEFGAMHVHHGELRHPDLPRF